MDLSYEQKAAVNWAWRTEGLDRILDENDDPESGKLQLLQFRVLTKAESLTPGECQEAITYFSGLAGKYGYDKGPLRFRESEN